MRVFDCFTYLEEAEMVAARVAEWQHVANVTHVLVEGDRTFTGEPKPALSEALGAVPRLYRHLARLPELAASAWERERAQRDAIYAAVASLGPEPDDLLLLCDADEIARADALAAVLDATDAGLTTLWADSFVYDLHHRQAEPWPHPQAMRWRACRPDLSALRLASWAAAVPEAAWHFSYFGGPERIGRKLRSFSHVEYSSAEWSDPARAARRVELGVHVTGEELLVGDWPLPEHIVRALAVT